MSCVGDAAEAVGAVLVAPDRRTDQRAEQLHPPGQALGRQARDPLAHQRPPGQRGARSAASTASAVGWPGRASQVAHERRPHAARLKPGQHRLGRASGRLATNRRRRRPRADACDVEVLVERARQARRRRKRSISSRTARRAASCAPRTDDGGRRGAARRSARCRLRARPAPRPGPAWPCRLTCGTDRPTLISARSLSPPGSCSSARRDVGLQRILRRLQHRHAVQAGDLASSRPSATRPTRPSSTGAGTRRRSAASAASICSL